MAEHADASGVRIAVVDPDTLQATEFAPANWQAGSANRIDTDVSGRNLLVSLDDPGHGARLFMLTEGAPPQELAHAYGVAVW